MVGPTLEICDSPAPRMVSYVTHLAETVNDDLARALRITQFILHDHADSRRPPSDQAPGLVEVPARPAILAAPRVTGLMSGSDFFCHPVAGQTRLLQRDHHDLSPSHRKRFGGAHASTIAPRRAAPLPRRPPPSPDLPPGLNRVPLTEVSISGVPVRHNGRATETGRNDALHADDLPRRVLRG